MEEQPLKKTMISGHTVSHDLTVGNGVRHLMHGADAEEAKEIFAKAYRKGFAKFKDNMGFKYKLVYHNGRYQLSK